MNKLYIFLFVGSIACQNCFSQNVFPAAGNVGMGTTNPQGPLNIRGTSLWGTIKISPSTENAETGIGFSPHVSETDYTNMWFMGVGGWNTGQAFVIGTSASPSLTLQTNGFTGIGTTSPNTKLQVNSDNNGTGQNNWIASNVGGTSGDRVVMGILNGVATIGSHNNALNAWSNLAINPDSYGNVSIGTADAKGHRLAVNGSIVATEVVVKNYSNWPDYVFRPSYHLRSLTDVKAYIGRNGHLPDIPSASLVEKEGVNLGEMNRLLVKKLEELTLYLIENDKKDKQKDLLLESLQKQINQLKRLK